MSSCAINGNPAIPGPSTVPKGRSHFLLRSFLVVSIASSILTTMVGVLAFYASQRSLPLILHKFTFLSSVGAVNSCILSLSGGLLFLMGFTAWAVHFRQAS